MPRRRQPTEDRPIESARRRASDAAPPSGGLDRYVDIANFRAGLRSFLWHSEEVARRHDLTPQRYLLLLLVKGAPDRSERMTFTALAERLKLSINTVAELVARAEAAGLVGREQSRDDRRVFYIRLTPEGERRLAAAVAETERDRRELEQSFEALVASFRGAGRG